MEGLDLLGATLADQYIVLRIKRVDRDRLKAKLGGSTGALAGPALTMIDASGALMLDRLSRRLRDRGIRMLLGHISAGGKLGRAVKGAGVFTDKQHPDWFADTDRAIEWAEQQLLGDAHFAPVGSELAIGDFALTQGLQDGELDFLKRYLDRQLFPARAALYHQGQSGDCMYLLARGAVSIVAEDPGDTGKHHRVVTLSAGVIFGESAVVEGGTRSVTAIAEEDVVTYALSRKNLDAIHALNPDLYRRLVLNMLAHLSGLLRMTSSILHDTSDSVR